MATLPLTKKTKNELLEEYQKLLSQHEELRRTAQLVADPQSVALLTKAEGYTVDQLTQSIAALKSSVNATLNELAEKLISEAQKFGELQKAVELAKKNLELNYHIQVAADTLDRLILEHKTKTLALEEEAAVKRRDWMREQEEHEYSFNLQLRRLQDEFELKKAKQDRSLKDREDALRSQEQELAQLHSQVQGFPVQIDRAQKEREQEAAKRLKAEFDAQMAAVKRESDAQEDLFKLRVNNLEERLKAWQAENALLRGEVEKANKRVQELAVKIIESGSRTISPVEEQKDVQP